MMKDRYTPGPWKLIKELHHWTVGAEGKPEIGQILQEANANLIVAAPELYEALKEAELSICRLCRVINPQHKTCTTCDEIEIYRKAIAKAEGR